MSKIENIENDNINKKKSILFLFDNNLDKFTKAKIILILMF